MAARDIVCSSRHDGLRLSFHVYNAVSDVDAVLQALQENRGLLVTSRLQTDNG
jgi:selenocysteine lyase/cysteine desulfurase